MRRNWTQIDVACGSETADILAVEIAESFGGSVEYIPGGIRFYLDSTGFIAQKERLRQIVDSVPALPGEGSVSLAFSEIADQDWCRIWKEGFKPLPVGKRFLIAPTWEKAPGDPERLVIRLDPGRAFGTGHHETTRLCLEWLENCPVRTSLLDIGTGSGILAIGAGLLGFEKVVGIDNDPEATAVAEENVKLNELADTVRILCATPVEVGGSFDVIISNIESKPLIGMSEAIASKLRKNGFSALSGILVEQAAEVCAEYEKRGLSFAGVLTAGEWSLLAFRNEMERG